MSEIRAKLERSEDATKMEALIVLRCPKERIGDLEDAVEGLSKAIEGVETRESIWVPPGLKVVAFVQIKSTPDRMFG
jgi:hypothetical protein